MDFEKATLKKAAVSTLPLWAQAEQERLQQQQQHHHHLKQHSVGRLDRLPEESHDQETTPPGGASSPTLQSLFKPSSSKSASTSGLSTTSSTRALTSPVDDKGTQHGTTPGSSSSAAASTSASGSAPGIKAPPQLHSISTISTGVSQPQDWSVFATMSNVSTISDIPRKYQGTLVGTNNSGAMGPGANALAGLRKFPLKLDEIFKTRSTGHVPIDIEGDEDSPVCTCTCSQHKRGGMGHRMGSKRRYEKESRESMRGYPSGQCVSTDPPQETTWDEKDAELPLTQGQSTATNTAFNLEAMKAFLNSPLFSNFLKSLTIMAAVSLFAIALDAIIILVKAPDQQTQLTNDNAALIVTVILSLMTIAYSCFTIFLESRRPPEGLDTTNSKPLIVIFSEIIASIVWAQVLSVTIYIYIWTYGCTAAGERQLEKQWRQDIADQHLTGKLCRRQGAMVGLELLLVLLLIFNFYTHLAQNFKFIRAVV